MKKLVKILLLVSTVVCCAFGFAACDLFGAPTGGENGGANTEQGTTPNAGNGEENSTPNAGNGEENGTPNAGNGEENSTPNAGNGEENSTPNAGNGEGNSTLNAGNGEHVHAYEKWIVLSEPTCATSGSREWSCACGEKRAENIPATGHDYKNGSCSICGERKATDGLWYVLSEDETYYSVAGIGLAETWKIVIPSTYKNLPVRAIANAAFSSTLITEVYIPDSVTSIGKYAFEDCSSLTAVYINDIAKWCAIDFKSFDSNPLYYAKNLYLNGTLVTDLVIPDGVTTIGDYAFLNCSGLTSIEIPNSVTTIGDYAFLNCSGLTSIEIPNSVTTIGSSAFEDCSGLTSIEIPNSVTTIGSSAFEDCSGLTAVRINDIAKWCAIEFFGSNWGYYSNPLSYAKNLYLNGTLVTELVIPDGVTTIGSGAFRNCSSLTSIEIGNSVTTIGDFAFYGCSGLTAVRINDIAKWYAIDFKNATSNPLCYANNLYLNGALVTDLIIPDGVTTIGNYVFSGCSSLTSIEIPNSVTTIGEGAFGNCSGLTSIEIPNSVTTIGNSAFYNCSGLTSIEIPNSVTTIGHYTFENCSGLTSIEIPNSVTMIGEYAFSGCSDLQKVYYNGTADEWNEISMVSYGKEELTSAIRYYYSETQPTGRGNYWHYVDGEIVEW